MVRYLFILLALFTFSFHSNDAAAWGWGNNYYVVVPPSPGWGTQPQIPYQPYDPGRDLNMLMQNHLMMEQAGLLRAQRQQMQQAQQYQYQQQRQQMAYVQRVLTKAGYNPGPIDGIFGPSTVKAWEAFARDRGINPTQLGEMIPALQRADAGTE